eukprot:5728493-Amphidinium_carterae.1
MDEDEDPSVNKFSTIDGALPDLAPGPTRLLNPHGTLEPSRVVCRYVDRRMLRREAGRWQSPCDRLRRK